MKRSTPRRISTISLIMALVLVFSTFPAFALDVGNGAKSTDMSKPDVPFSFKLEEGDLAFSELKNAVLDPADIPDVISPSLAAEREHVNRLYAQEQDDYTVMFQNRDGSKTTYVFSKPVKIGRNSLSAAALAGSSSEDVFAFSSHGLDYKIGSSLRALDRLDKSFLDGKIYYYNIGYAEITKTSGRLVSQGTEITEDVREWSRGKVMPGSRLSSPSGTSDDIGSSGSYVLMYTASEMAGIVNLKNHYTQTYLKNNGQAPVLSAATSIYLTTTPYRWVLQYYTAGRYIIKSMYGFTSSSQLMLKYNSTYTSVSLESGTNTNALWTIDSESNGSGILYYYLRPYVAGGTEKALNSSLGFTNAAAGSCTSQCGWQILNKRDIPVSVTPKQNAVVSIESDVINLLTIIPSDAETMINWCGDSNNLFDDQGDYTVFSLSGKHHIWMEELYSGLTIAEDDEWCVLIYDNHNLFENNRTYMIRPYISDNTNYATSNLLTLTKTADSSSNSLSAIPLYNGNNSSYSAKWTDKSQTFTFSYLETGKYKIGATLASEQYLNVPPYNSTYNSNDFSNYTMTYQEDVCNWIGYAGMESIAENSAVSKASSRDWRIIPAGTISIGGSTYGKYCIVYVDSGGTTKALNHTVSNGNGVTVGLFSDDETSVWVINKVGLNVPWIKQTQITWCGYATVLQVIYGAGKSDCLTNSAILHTQMGVVKDSFHANGGDSMNQDTICNMLNDSKHFSDGSFDYQHYHYERNDEQSHEDFISNYSESEFVGIIQASISNDWAPFMLTDTGGAPYKIEYNGLSHYICIIGYDSISNTVLISNCHYSQSIGGLYAIPLSSIYNNITLLFHSVTGGQINE